MDKGLLNLSTLDFLLEITNQSLTFHRENTIEYESNKVAIEAQLDEDLLNSLLAKFENSLVELGGNKVLAAYIEFRITEIKKALRNKESLSSAYLKNPQYGVQYFSLIYHILSEKKKMLNKVPD